mmetsp:Transcript_38909/g.96442  ORF Transcript_38909/g.96442 Transcript_38909/m.96442 type:complete len:84 (+) Transcript_38909:416-667(+)
MSGPLHKASSVVSALVDQLGLERSQVQRSYGIWVSTRGGAVLASSTPDERKSRLLQRLGPCRRWSSQPSAKPRTTPFASCRQR